MPDAALWAEILAMFFGRFEIIVLIVSLIKLGKDAFVSCRMQDTLFGVKRYDKGKADSGLQVGADPGNDPL
jgi:hypothetical protein